MGKTFQKREATVRKVCVLAGLIIIVCAVVVITHWPALSARTIAFDDEHYLLNNQLVQNPSWDSAKRFLREVRRPSTVDGYYQPLTMISLMLDCKMGGGAENLRVFHLTSLAFHVANTLLIILILYMLFGNVLAAAIVGVLFGVHPVTVEAIPWVAERKTLLAAFFVFWSLLFYIQYSKRGNWFFYGASLVLYVVALMSKPTSIALPALLLILDFWPLKRLGKKAILEKIPFFVIGFVFAGVIFFSQSETFGVRTPGEQGLTRILFILCYNNVLYLSNIFWPVNLSLFYAFPSAMVIGNPDIIMSLVCSGVLIVALLVSLCRVKWVMSCWLFFFVAIFPTMGVVGFHDNIAADRHVYIPLLGIAILLARLLCVFFESSAKRALRSICQVCVIAIIILLGLSTRRHLAYWQDTEVHYRRMVELAPGEAIPLNGLGAVLNEKGRFDEAVEQFREALEQESTIREVVFYNLGITLEKQGKSGEAAKSFYQALQISPKHIEARYSLGGIFEGYGKFNKAIECYERVLIDGSKAKSSVYYDALNNIGMIYGKQGKLDKAIEYLERAIQTNDKCDRAYANMGNVFYLQNRLDEAIKCFRYALELNPNQINARNGLKLAMEKKKR